MKNVIEPCCIATQLPQVMKTAKQGVFYSNGDWGVKALMNAVSYLVEKDATVVLLMPTVNVWFCRVLRERAGEPSALHVQEEPEHGGVHPL